MVWSSSWCRTLQLSDCSVGDKFSWRRLHASGDGGAGLLPCRDISGSQTPMLAVMVLVCVSVEERGVGRDRNRACRTLHLAVKMLSVKLVEVLTRVLARSALPLPHMFAHDSKAVPGSTIAPSSPSTCLCVQAPFRTRTTFGATYCTLVMVWWCS